MESDSIREPKNKLVRFSSQVVEDIRKEFNLHKKADREQAIAIIEEWIKMQDHFIKKDFSKYYIERSIITSKGSLERTKIQFDKMCTFRTLMPKYFQIRNLKESELMHILDKAYIGIMPKLTKEYHRVVIVKVKPNVVTKSTDYTMFYKLLFIMAEYFKANDFCRGQILIGDCFDANVTDVLSSINLVELQQVIPVVTEGYGCKIKGIYFVTASKFIEGFIKLVKPLFSEKIGSRIHAVTTRKSLKDLLDRDVLPEEYGGTEESVEKLHEDLLEGLSAIPVQELLEEMAKAKTDESKRNIDVFNDRYMGVAGTFRTLTLD